MTRDIAARRAPSTIARRLTRAALQSAATLAALTTLACGGTGTREADSAAVSGAAPAAAASPAAPSVATPVHAADSASPTLVVYKSPTCGCCSAWVDHMTENGFRVEIHDMEDVSPVKEAHGVTPRLASCHTALIGGYVLEGHVPAADVRRLLRERPQVAGLAVPGMPSGSPGMEGPRRDRYDVLTFDRGGRTSVYASY